MLKWTLPASAEALLSAPLAAAAPADAAPRAEEARTPLANLRGGVRSVHADDDAIHPQDRRCKWSRAGLRGPCWGPRFARADGTDTRGSSVFDRFAA